MGKTGDGCEVTSYPSMYPNVSKIPQNEDIELKTRKRILMGT